MVLYYVILFAAYLSKDVLGQSPLDDATVQCLEGWYQYGNNCFKTGGKMSRTFVTWNTARDRCIDLSADLASVHSREELEFLITFPLLNVEASVWIGLNDKEKSGEHVWTDGSPANFKNWDENEPTLEYDNIKENCVQMIFNAYNGNKMGKWNDLICNRLISYMCEMPANPELSNSNPKYCTEGGGYKLHSSCFHYINTPMSWAEAEDHCQTRFDGNLVAIQDHTVHRFLNYMLKEQNIFSPLWIGIKAMGEKKPEKWSSGWLLLFGNWVEDLSQSQLKAGDCVARLRSGSWDIRPCDRKYAFICEVNSVRPPILEPSLEGSYCPSEPPGWKDLGGDSCFFYDDNVDITWHEANFQCLRKGGTLASLHSNEEMRSLEQLLRYKNRMIFYLGLFRKHDDNFVWVDRSDTNYMNFHDDEPNSKEEQCTDFSVDSMRWNDIACNDKHGYVCSVKKTPPDVQLSEENVICSGELMIID